MNNLKKFANEAEYSAATLNYPAVSWVVSGDTVHFDKEAPTPPTPVNDKVMFATNGDGNGESNMVFYNCGSSGAESEITGLTINDVAVTPITCTTETQYDASQVYVVKIELNDVLGTVVDDWFTGDLGIASASLAPTIDVFYPSWVTSIGSHFPSNASVIVCEATTPPSVEGLASTFTEAISIYVPDSVVDTYKENGYWREMSDYIYPISQYSGNLPV